MAIPGLSHSCVAAPLFSLCAILLAPAPVPAQEIPLDHCDSLPVIHVKAAGKDVRFLVDTAATTILNLASFAGGTAEDVSITSWSGTLATSAKEVTLSELEIGNTKFVRIKLPAIDLSAIGKACGRPVDGILGVDILRRLADFVPRNKIRVMWRNPLCGVRA